MSYAIVNSTTGAVENITEWDGLTPWSPPSGTTAVLADEDAVIGGTYANGVFTKPPVPLPTQEELDYQALIESMQTKLRNFFDAFLTEEELDILIQRIAGG